jgi:putative hydrolase of the HAD superfamily
MTLTVSENTLIVFDLDDTIYHEIDFVKSAYGEIARSIDPEKGLHIYTSMLDSFSRNENVFIKLIDDFPHLTLSGLLETYRNHFPVIEPVEGIINLLEKLKALNVHMVLLTDGRSRTQRNKILSLGIENFFNEILISEEINAEKISGYAFKKLDNQYKNHQKISIGDNVHKDFKWPFILGWITIGLKNRGNNIHSQDDTEESVQPQYYIDSFTELVLNYE